MKSNINYKIFILLILIIIPVGILYFNLGDDILDRLLIGNNLVEGSAFGMLSGTTAAQQQQALSSALQTRATGTGTSAIQITPSHNYSNICHPKKANFYNIPEGTVIETKTFTTPSTCKRQCDIKNCDLYLIKNNECKLYNLENSNFTGAEVNCNNEILPETIDGKNYSHNGEGYIKKSFYNNNKNKFTHKDYLLEQANKIKSDYMDINDKLNRLASNPGQNSLSRINLRDQYNSVNTKIEKVADYLDLNKNFIYSHLILDPPYTRSKQESDIVNLGGKNLSHTEMLNELNKMNTNSNNIESRLNNDNIEYERRYLIYTILTILMTITIFILVIYKFIPDLLTDKFVIIYFVGVLLLLFFIHYYFKV